MVELKILKKSNECKARLGRLFTDHGEIDTPVFMPVGTNGTVKGLWQNQLESLQASIILGNAFHLYLRPGLDVLREFGGLHRFMSWQHSILTDSGGFQVFSLSDKKILEEGVKFRSPLDGSKIFMTPELSMEIQRAIGSDIAMAFDECVEPDASREYVEGSVGRTTRWARRCIEAHRGSGQALFGIVQGGFFEDLRERSAAEITSMDFDGFALGGLSVGEEFSITTRILSRSVDLLPSDRARYLMGIGSPDIILAAVENGIDMFDCVMPTRNGRNGMLFTSKGTINLRNEKWKDDFSPLDAEGTSYVDHEYSRAYVKHLFKAGEMLGPMIASIHNLAFYQWLVSEARKHLEQGDFTSWKSTMVKQLSVKL